MLVQIIAIALLVLSQVLDWHSTLAFLKRGRAHEGNARIAWLQRKLGPSRAMIVKGLAHLPLAVAIWLLPWWASVGLLPYLIHYALVIRNNYRLARL